MGLAKPTSNMHRPTEISANTMAAPAKDRGDLFRLLFAQIPCNQNGNAHGKLRHHKGDQIQHLASRGDGGEPGCGAEPSHHQQINGPVSCLQNQRTQDGNHEPEQLR